MGDLEILESTDDHAIAKWRSVGLYVWRGTTTVRAARELARTIGLAREADPRGPGVLLGVVEAGTPPPSSEARAALAESLESGAGYVRASALVFEGEGFQASMVRAVATGLALLARTDFPHQVFADVASASDWLERRTRAVGAPRYQAAELQAALRELRSAPRR